MKAALPARAEGFRKSRREEIMSKAPLVSSLSRLNEDIVVQGREQVYTFLVGKAGCLCISFALEIEIETIGSFECHLRAKGRFIRAVERKSLVARNDDFHALGAG